MTRRFDLGPVLVALAAIVLLVSLFLDWFGPATAWDVFEVVDVLLAALAVAAGVIVAGMLFPEIAVTERRWLPAVVLAATVLVAAEIVDPPPAAAGEAAGTGAWLAFGAAIAMVVGAVLSFGRVSVAVALEGRQTKERVAVVDHRQDTTETAALSPHTERPRRRTAESQTRSRPAERTGE
jgi:hypothetical protein